MNIKLVLLTFTFSSLKILASNGGMAALTDNSQHDNNEVNSSVTSPRAPEITPNAT